MATEPRFHVGDICRVKDYCTLADEKGAVIDSDCDILFRTSTGETWYFWYDERAVCGLSFTIKEIIPRRGSFLYRCEEEYHLEYKGLFEDALELSTPAQSPIDSASLIKGLSGLFGEAK